MSREVVVEGRTQCPVCKTDKAFTLWVDKGNLNNIQLAERVSSTISRQYAEVINLNHNGHESRLIKTHRASKDVADCWVGHCRKPVFKTVENRKLRRSFSYCESHYYAGRLINAALRKEGKRVYKPLLEKIVNAHSKDGDAIPSDDSN